MYEAEIKGGRLGIAPEKLLRAMLLQVLYSVRSPENTRRSLVADLRPPFTTVPLHLKPLALSKR